LPSTAQPSKESSDQTRNNGNAVKEADLSANAKWLNEFFGWIFKQYKGVPEFLHLWIKSLNDAAKKVANTVSLTLIRLSFAKLRERC